MNIILFVFIALCTLFMATSLNNMATTTNAISHFQEVSHASDYMLIAQSDKKIDTWLESNTLVQDYSHEAGLAVVQKDVTVKGKEFDTHETLFLFTMPKTYNLILDRNDEVLTNVEEGHIALSYADANSNNLKVGDEVTITVGSKETTLKISHITKDMLFGSTYMGMSRLALNEADFDYLTKEEVLGTVTLYSVMSNDPLSFERSLQNQPFTMYTNFDKEMLENVYTMDMILAAILVAVSIILIAIALIILRFTISFTLQEDFREIGVMKAVGLTNGAIKRLYLAKYVSLSVVGALLGVVLSFLLSALMMEGVKNNMAMEGATANLAMSVASGIATVVLVLAFCYLTLGKVNKLSAVQAMRNGATGANYKTHKLYSLHRHTSPPLALHLALHDILSNTKHYLALIVTFILGTLMVILPINTINTLKSPDMIEYFGMAASDFYISTQDVEGLVMSMSREHETISVEHIEEILDDLEHTYRKAGVAVDLHVDCRFNISVYVDDPNDSISLMAIQAVDYPASGYSFFTEETAPLAENEVAITKIAAERIGASIGDTIHVTLGGKTKKYLVTGTYETFNMMGLGFRFSSTAPLDYNYYTGIWSVQGDFIDRDNVEEQFNQVKEATPDFTIQTATEHAAEYLDSIINSLDSIQTMIIVVVVLINCLITVLLVRSFMAREIGEIALLKSIGFRNTSLRAWQALRIIIVLLCSIVLGCVLSNAFNPVLREVTFGIMGASEVAFNIVWYEVYLLYPLGLFVVTALSAVLSIGNLNRYQLKDIGATE